MAEQPVSNVKIYDRPERTGPSPLILVIVLLIVLALGFVAYRAFHSTPSTNANAAPGANTQMARPAGGG
jgi:flagellar basal body-associated protein FliL